MNQFDRDEEGASLVFALVFLGLFALAVTALLGLTDTGLRAGNMVQAQSEDLYALDGAVEAALADLRTALPLDATSGCPTQAYRSSAVNGRSVLVECDAAAGLPAGGSVNDLNSPKHAIVTTSTSAAETGFLHGSNSDLVVGGPVFSRSTISNQAAHAVLRVEGDLQARTSCTGTIEVVSPGLVQDCATAEDVDPDYASRLSGVPSRQDVPPCQPGGIVILSPGWYDSVSELNALTNGGGCNALLHFTPGEYYFDFRDGAADSRVWIVDDGSLQIIGGTLSDPTLSTPTATVPGGCDGTKPGVQFVFGGESRLLVRDAERGMEICATPSATQQQIAVYGLPSGSSDVSTPASSQPTSTAATPSDAFTDPSATAEYAIDGSVSPDVALGQNAVAARDFSFAASRLAGSELTAAKLVIGHAQSRRVSALSVTTDPGLPTATSTPLNNACNDNSTPCAIQESEIDVLDYLEADAARLAGFNVRFEARGPNGNQTGIAELDGIRLELTWTTFGLKGQAGCVTATGYPGSVGTCPFLSTEGAKANLVVRGTVYAPLAVLDIQLTNAAFQVFERGVVSRVLHLAVTPASTMTGSVISLPTAGSGGVAEQSFTLRACIADPAASICAPQDVRLIVGGAVLGSTPRGLRLESWTVER